MRALQSGGQPGRVEFRLHDDAGGRRLGTSLDLVMDARPYRFMVRVLVALMKGWLES